MKPTVHVKSIPDATTKRMKNHVIECLEDNSPDTAILRFGTNNLKNNESAEDIETDSYDEPSNICKKRKENCSSL